MLILATIALASAIRFDESEPSNEEYESVNRPAKTKLRPKKDFNIHIVKKRGGKVRQIHLYPVKSHYRDDGRERDTHTESETHEHVGYNSKQQEAAAAESSKVEKMIDVDGNDQDNAGTDHHHYEQKQKIRVKHHHHHHHHNHIKTIVKKEPYPVRH